jgi:hypothetical protein
MIARERVSNGIAGYSLIQSGIFRCFCYGQWSLPLPVPLLPLLPRQSRLYLSESMLPVSLCHPTSWRVLVHSP